MRTGTRTCLNTIKMFRINISFDGYGCRLMSHNRILPQSNTQPMHTEIQTNRNASHFGCVRCIVLRRTEWQNTRIGFAISKERMEMGKTADMTPAPNVCDSDNCNALCVVVVAVNSTLWQTILRFFSLSIHFFCTYRLCQMESLSISIRRLLRRQRGTTEWMMYIRILECKSHAFLDINTLLVCKMKELFDSKMADNVLIVFTLACVCGCSLSAALCFISFRILFVDATIRHTPHIHRP